MKLPRENVYVCQQGHFNVTVDVDHGVTPMFLGCRRGGCKEMAQSSMYPKTPRPFNVPPPEFEWYKMTDEEARMEEELHPGSWSHHKNGGLFLRGRTEKEPVYHEGEY